MTEKLGSKKCWGCKETKKLSEFGNNRSGKHGKAGYCLLCAREQARRAYLRRYRLVYEKYDNACAFCKTTENLHVHHKNGKIAGDGLSNLILVCRDCHYDKCHQGAWHKRASILSCLLCKHEWIKRGEKKPNTCPKCKSPYWSKPRIKKTNKK